MGKYTAPLFGSVDISPITAPPIPNMLDYFNPIVDRSRTKKNEFGQTYESDLFINNTLFRFNSGSVQRATFNGFYDVISQTTWLSQASRPFCIFAMPAISGNTQYSEENYNVSAKDKAWPVALYHDMPTFHYFIVAETSGATLNYKRNKRNERTGDYISAYAKRNTGMCTGSDYREYGEAPELYLKGDAYVDEYALNSYEMSATSTIPGVYSAFTNFGDLLSQRDGNNRYGVRWYGYSQDFGCYNQTDMITVTTLVGQWLSQNPELVRKLFIYDAEYNVGAFTYLSYPKMGCNIISDIPIFTIDSWSEMVKYFEKKPFVSENDPQPPSDWSTDWDIYVKGQQRPQIFITMKSDKVDEWLEDLAENESGVTKEDVKIEYRYREYDYDIPYDPSEPLPPPTDDVYEMISWITDRYNVSRETSYDENILLNYPAVTSYIGEDYTSDFAIDGLFPFYAQLEFRLRYGKYYSAWCYYKIGVIGSPSVPDFTRMTNEGAMVQEQSVLDASTVTLHYDEFPPNYNPWPEVPDPPMPPVPPGNTDPTPVPAGQNGIGLLTQTYKITPATAKALGRFFWGGDLFQKIKALNLSPIENVVSLYIMPIDVSGQSSTIVIGDVDTNLNGDVISQVPLYTVGEFEFKGRYQSFLDFEPYTSAFLFLPFVGFVQIDPIYFTNRTLKVVYSFDLVCGMCNAMLFADGLYIESHQGNCGIDIPLVAGNRAQLTVGLASSLFSTAITPATAAGTTAKVAKSAKMASMAASAGNDIVGSLANYATGFHSSRQGGYNPTLAWSETRTCYIVIESSQASHSATYNKDKGRPCMASATIGSLRGYTEVDANVDLSGIAGASNAEREMIRALLSNGFIA